MNRKISADENLHATHAVALYLGLKRKLDREKLLSILREAVDIEVEFIVDAVPCRLLGLNSDSMSEYVRYVADFWLVQLKEEPFYGAKQPFQFMVAISLLPKQNMFESRVSSYQLSVARGAFATDDDF